MIVVSDTSPLNYLILIGQDHTLPALFGQVFAPPAVVAELKRSKAPALVKLGELHAAPHLGFEVEAA